MSKSHPKAYPNMSLSSPPCSSQPGSSGPRLCLLPQLALPGSPPPGLCSCILGDSGSCSGRGSCKVPICDGLSWEGAKDAVTHPACLLPDPQLPPLAGVGIFRSSSNLPRAEPDLDGAFPSLLTGKIKSRMMLILVIEHHHDDALVQPCLLVR